MPDNPTEAVRAIVQNVVGTRSQITESTRLFHDLQISGDDADDLLLQVHEAFHTVFDDFDFKQYFPTEFQSSYVGLASLLGFPMQRKPFTFGHLVRVVEAGRWFEPS